MTATPEANHASLCQRGTRAADERAIVADLVDVTDVQAHMAMDVAGYDAAGARAVLAMLTRLEPAEAMDAVLRATWEVNQFATGCCDEHTPDAATAAATIADAAARLGRSPADVPAPAPRASTRTHIAFTIALSSVVYALATLALIIAF